MSDLEELWKLHSLPMISMRGMVPFPSSLPMMPMFIGRELSKRTLLHAGINSGVAVLFLCPQKNEETEEPSIADLFSVGMISIVGKPSKQRDPERIATLHGGVFPARLRRLRSPDGVPIAEVEPFGRWYPTETLEGHAEAWNSILSEYRKLRLDNDIASQGADSKSTLINILHNMVFTLPGISLAEQVSLIESETPEAAFACVKRLIRLRV